MKPNKRVLVAVLVTATLMVLGAAQAAAQMNNVTIDLVAQNFSFDKSTITVPAGAAVTVNFDNKDSGIPHNFAVYQSASARKVVFKGKVITGPGKITYTFTAPTTPGTYYFRCDVHPRTMTGSFVVR